MRSTYLSFSPPCLSELEIQEVVDTLRGDWLSAGPKTKQFEQDFAQFVEAENALAMNSCTAALHIAMLLHGVGEGDEVITTPMTFCATANVVEHVGGKVVFADVDEDTLLINPREIEAKITPRTKVIVPVHFAGHPCDMDAINAIAARHGVAVVEDAAHCMPSRIGDRPVGASQNLTAFSFYATKNMTTGEGGMLTGPAALVDRARSMVLHGMTRNAWNRFAKGGSWRYDVEAPGFKYNMTDLQASLGLVQLRRLAELYERRSRVYSIYEGAFQNSPFLRPLALREGYLSSLHLYVIRLRAERLKISRDEFIEQLNARNIGSSVHYTPVHRLKYYAEKYGLKPDDFPVANSSFETMLSLPLCSRMTESDAADVVAAVNDICQTFSVGNSV